ncbi:MAG: class I SAM-dependent methyltransferase [Kiritimatiellota bacterium]|nr:class I SAM-dependent methyltransferase [Kiritimatiellota bacterium]
MSYDVKREAHVHGKLWAKQASGFFSDPNMAKGYVAAIMRVASNDKPSAIADLGGGTGFILGQLIKTGLAENIKLVNIDESDSQLAMCKDPRITPMKGTFESFRRADIVSETGRMMLISRSVLQYGGIFNQKPWLDHVRGQLKPGEWFVHQSGCAEDAEGALALDVLFEQMGVGKWVPHKEAFARLLVQAGFEITDDFPVPAVEMVSEELAVRYGVSPDDLARIEADLRRTCSNRPDLVKFAPSGFAFNFPYRVFLCKIKV